MAYEFYHDLLHARTSVPAPTAVHGFTGPVQTACSYFLTVLLQMHIFTPDFLHIYRGGGLVSTILFCFYGPPIVLKHRLGLLISTALHLAVSYLIILVQVVFCLGNSVY